MSYNPRVCKSVVHKETFALLSAGTRVVSKDDVLYTIKVLERKKNHVLIHYIGYDSKFDK